MEVLIMTREEFLVSVDNISTEISDLHKQISTISGMLAVLRQSTKETDLAMCSLISLIETNTNNVLNDKLNKIGADIHKVLGMGKCLEDKPVKQRKPRTDTTNKPKQTRQRNKVVEEKTTEQVVKEEKAE
jgi:hypothetical protein